MRKLRNTVLVVFLSKKILHILSLHWVFPLSMDEFVFDAITSLILTKSILLTAEFSSVYHRFKFYVFYDEKILINHPMWEQKKNG